MWFTEHGYVQPANNEKIGGGNAIAKMTPQGQITEYPVPSKGIGPEYLTLAPDGNIWFTEDPTPENSTSQIGFITPAGSVTEFPLHVDSWGAHQIAFGPDGALWFTESGYDTVDTDISSDSVPIDFFPVPPNSFIGRITTSGQLTEFNLPDNTAPYGIVAAPDGNLWFTEQGEPTGDGTGILLGDDLLIGGDRFGGNAIGKITPQGILTQYSLPTANADPMGIVLGSDGALWFTEANAHAIGRITLSGSITEFNNLTANSFPVGITAGPDGNIWFTEANSPTGNAIGEIVLPHYVVTGPGAGGGPDVRVYNATNGNLVNEFYAYDSHFQGGVNAIMADMNLDGVPDIITAPGPGGGPDIRVFDGITGKIDMEFYAFSPSFKGGVNIAVGNFTDDGYPDIVCAAASGTPEVKVFDGKDGSILYDFFPYTLKFTGGVRVATGHVGGGPYDDIITGAGPGGGPEVKVYDGGGVANGGTPQNILFDFYAYASTFHGGVYVAAGNTTNQLTFYNIITGAGPGGPPEVKVFDATDVLNPTKPRVLVDYFAYDSHFQGGVRVFASANLDGDFKGDIITAPGAGGGPDVRVYDDQSTVLLNEFYAYDSRFSGGVFVGGY
jgi:streptogramin lyase